MFKKIFSALVLATSLVACTGDYTDWVNPQSNEQPETVAFGNGSVSEVGVIDFANEQPEQVQVCSITAPTASDAAYNQVIYKLNLGSEAMEIGADGKIAADVLKTFLETNYGKAPVQRDIVSTVEQWISDGTTAVKTATSGEFMVKAKLDAPVLYDHLYLIGAPSQWDPTCTSLPFTRDESKSIYDAPVFTITVPVAEGDTWFAFADDHTVATNDWSQVFGAREGNGFNLIGETGKLARRTELTDDGSFKISVNGDAKYMKITVNVLDGTYLIEKVNFVDYIYLPGNAQGWNPGTAPALKGDGAGLYTGFAYMDGEFKFTQERAWAAEYNNGSFSTCSADFDLGAKDGGNIKCNSTGLYYFEVNVVSGDLKATKINNMNLVGDFNGWNAADDAQQMTWNAAELCYEITGAGVTAAGWKFTANNSWDINLGGALNDLVGNGSNIDAVGKTIKLYPCRTTSDNIYCTVE